MAWQLDHDAPTGRVILTNHGRDAAYEVRAVVTVQGDTVISVAAQVPPNGHVLVESQTLKAEADEAFREHVRRENASTPGPYSRPQPMYIPTFVHVGAHVTWRSEFQRWQTWSEEGRHGL